MADVYSRINRKVNPPTFTKPQGKQQLPQGLDPVTAGRWGVWLLGQRQHQRAQQRSLAAAWYNDSHCLASRAIALIAKWHVNYYPGRWRAMCEVVGVKKGTAKEYISGRRRLPRFRRARLASFLEADLAERLEVIRLLKLPDPADDRMAENMRQGLAKMRQAGKVKRLRAIEERRRLSEAARTVE